MIMSIRSFHMHEQNIVANDEHVSGRLFIDSVLVCLHGISSMLYNRKRQNDIHLYFRNVRSFVINIFFLNETTTELAVKIDTMFLLLKVYLQYVTRWYM